MAKNVGIWIDHAKAIAVTIEGARTTIERTESGVEGHFRLTGGSRTKTPYGPQTIVNEQRPDERRKHQLHAYYRKIVASLRDADSIYLFGPAEAPREIAKEIARSKRLSARLAGVGRADKMTERQIAAKVRAFYRASEERLHRPAPHRRGAR
jgi:hypothetical protein